MPAVHTLLTFALIALGMVLRNSDWDWSGAEEEFRRAIALNPKYPTAHHWFAGVLNVLGRNEEALAEIQQAQDLDPLSPLINSALGLISSQNGKEEVAIEILRKQISLDPSFVVAELP